MTSFNQENLKLPLDKNVKEPFIIGRNCFKADFSRLFIVLNIY